MEPTFLNQVSQNLTQYPSISPPQGKESGVHLPFVDKTWPRLQAKPSPEAVKVKNDPLTTMKKIEAFFETKEKCYLSASRPNPWSLRGVYNSIHFKVELFRTSATEEEKVYVITFKKLASTKDFGFGDFHKSFLDFCSHIGQNCAKPEEKLPSGPHFPSESVPSPPVPWISREAQLQETCTLLKRWFKGGDRGQQEALQIVVDTVSNNCPPQEIWVISNSLQLSSWLTSGDSPLMKEGKVQNLAVTLVLKLLETRTPAVLASVPSLVEKLGSVLQGVYLITSAICHDTHVVARRCLKTIQNFDREENSDVTKLLETTPPFSCFRYPSDI